MIILAWLSFFILATGTAFLLKGLVSKHDAEEGRAISILLIFVLVPLAFVILYLVGR
jgi:uncharacterized membrane protein YozB (DUF420 family)